MNTIKALTTCRKNIKILLEGISIKILRVPSFALKYGRLLRTDGRHYERWRRPPHAYCACCFQVGIRNGRPDDDVETNSGSPHEFEAHLREEMGGDREEHMSSNFAANISHS